MTNSEYIRQHLSESKLAALLSEYGCDKCVARKYCEKRYPEGTWNGFRCEKLIKEWLKQERTTKNRNKPL